MINYNPKKWFIFILTFHKSDTIRKLWPVLVFVLVYSFLVALFFTNIFVMPDTSHLKNISIVHSLLSFVISMLLVFRTNTAYDRWWEGRRMWGNLVNNSRNLALKLNSILPAEHKEERIYFATMIGNYASALKNHLRTAYLPNELQQHIWFNKKLLKQEHHIPNRIAREIFNKIHLLNKSGLLNNEELLYINAELTSFTDICGSCERIRNTPIPFSYSSFLKKFIFYFVMTLPFTLVFSVGYICVPIVGFIFYVLTSIELIAEEIEDPFGKDANDLPTEQITKNIRKTVNEIFGNE